MNWVLPYECLDLILRPNTTLWLGSFVQFWWPWDHISTYRWGIQLQGWLILPLLVEWVSHKSLFLVWSWSWHVSFLWLHMRQVAFLCCLKLFTNHLFFTITLHWSWTDVVISLHFWSSVTLLWVIFSLDLLENDITLRLAFFMQNLIEELCF